MTERTTEPTIPDILSAVQTFAQHYHDVGVSLVALHDKLTGHDVESKRERAALREQMYTLQRSIDRRLDALGRELDIHTEQIAELQQARTELTMRLSDIEARLAHMNATE